LLRFSMATPLIERLFSALSFQNIELVEVQMEQKNEKSKMMQEKYSKVFASEFARYIGQDSLTVAKTFENVIHDQERFIEALTKVQIDVLSGTPLSRAFFKLSDVFGEAFINAVREGEVNGDIVASLNKYADLHT
jgi:type II secretory pathway component PulF